jgi:ATP-dependent Clp protease, protease subunit
MYAKSALKNLARSPCLAQRAAAVRRFHPLAGKWEETRNPVTGNLVPMVIEQTVR